MHMDTRKEIKTLAKYNTLIIEHTNVPRDEKDRLLCNIKEMRIIRFSLPPDTFRLVSACNTTKGIRDRLKELYHGDADLEYSLQTKLLSLFGSFVQNHMKS